MQQNEKKWDIRFLKLAKHIAQWSKDPSTQCGAIIVAPDRTIVSLGYNGFPRLMKDDDEFYFDREVKYQRVIHAEMNAILSAHRSVNGCTLYTWPFLSCPRCIVHVIQAGIIRCVGGVIPRQSIDRWSVQIIQTTDFLKEANIPYEIYNDEKLK